MIRVLTGPRQVVLAWTLAVGLLLLFLVRIVLPSATRLTYGFSAYFSAAALVSQGYRPAQFYDDTWFSTQTARLGFAGAEDIFRPNPPAAALLFSPLVGLGPANARVIWTGLNVLFLGLALVMLVHITRATSLEAAAGLVLLVIYQPVRVEMRLGQAYALLLLAEVVLLWAYLVRRDALAGLILGLMLSFKTAGLALPLLLAGQRRWAALAWTVLTMAGLLMLSLPWLGVAAWQAYLMSLLHLGGRPELAVTAFQSLSGFALHLFSLDPKWNPAPLLPAPWLALVLAAALGLVMVGVTLFLTRQLDPRDSRSGALAFAAWATLGIVLSPVSQDYHYTLILVPIALLAAYWRDTSRGLAMAAVTGVGILLTGASLPYMSPALTTGVQAVLAYPKFYGALLFWAVAVYGMRSELGVGKVRLVEAGQTV